MKDYEINSALRIAYEQSVIPFGIYQFKDMRISTLLLSNGFLKLFGYSNRDEALDKLEIELFRNIHPEDAARVADASVRFASGDNKYDVTYRSKMGDEYRIIHAMGMEIFTADGTRLCVVWYMDESAKVIHDDKEASLIAEIGQSYLNESILGKSNFDYLTGLPNMTYFFQLATTSRDKFLAEGEHCLIGYASMNGMKYFNQKFGFAEGDKILRSFAKLLAENFGNDNSCRVGQDNFAFFASVENVEEKINSVISEFEKIVAGRVTFRTGIYTSKMGAVDASLACDRARYACNTLRNQNRSGFVYFSNDMLEYENRRRYVIDNLDRAISEKWIRAYYQPIVRTANGKVSDEEALARWIDPEFGMLSPAEFIPILEDAKLIYKVDLHMVDEILKKMKDQAAAGLYVVPSSVNLSRTDFDACDIVKEITDRVDAAGIDRSMLTIEITESVVGSDFDFIKEQVERFQRLGFHVWMDDFGSGYSSLDVLQSIHFDLIKLDMRFMKQFDNGDKSRVIITELMKMALGLGIETVMEGVERADQVDFLKEVGCTKLQGYYFCKPIPFEEIVERGGNKFTIGFENPDESEYYTAIGRINLYDMTAVANEDSDMGDEDDFSKYFNSLPMAVLESNQEMMRVVRCNSSYRTFVEHVYSELDLDAPINFGVFDGKSGTNLVKALKICATGVSKIFIDEKKDDSVIHSIIRRIADNPVTGVVACAVVVLGVTKDSEEGITYADVANSLSADYMKLYYVSLEDEEFDEYTPDSMGEDLSVERHGLDFFETSRKDALELLYKDDVERVLSSFNRENVLKSIEESGTYTITYRLLIKGVPTYVSMKAIKMSKDDSHLIIGVNNVDAQMRQQEALEQMKEEQIAFSRIAALSGKYICIYTVDPETDSYTEFDASKDYEGIGLSKQGDGFFDIAMKESSRAIFEDDREHFQNTFTKENVLRTIEESGSFVIDYRLMIDDKPENVSLKAVLVEEKDGKKIIMGVSRFDD